MSIRTTLLHALSAATFAILSQPALAQSGNIDIRADARAAFVQPYGAALAQQLAEEIAAAADRSCLQSRNIGAQQIARAALEILTHYAGEIARVDDTPSQQSILFGLLHKKGDETSLARLRVLETSPAMQEVRKRQPAVANTNLANDTGEWLNRYIRRKNLPLKGALGFVVDGNDKMSILWETESSIPDDIAERAAPQLEELAELLTKYKQDIEDEIERLSPSQEQLLAVFSGIETRLEALCISATR